jgi:Tetratricopeptide repeat
MVGRGARVALVTGLPLVAGLVSNMATNAVDLPTAWTIWLWIIAITLILISVALTVHQHNAARNKADSGGDAGSMAPPRGGSAIGTMGHLAAYVDQPSEASGKTNDHPTVLRPARRLTVGRVPPRASAFQDRTVSGLEPGSHTGSIVLSGLDGVGKTQLAAEHARVLWDSGSIHIRLWIDASSRDQILSGFSNAATALFGAQDCDPGLATDLLFNWLSATEWPWLIVLKGLQDPNDLDGLWPPDSPQGQVVVTTQRFDAALRADGRHVVKIDTFKPEEARSYLVERLAENPHQTEGAAALAEALGNLPLALDLAATYITDHPDQTCATYLNRFNGERHALDQLQPGCLPEGLRTIAATWSLSIKRAEQMTPLARPLLTLASLMDPNGIPEEVLTTKAALSYLRAGGLRAVDVEVVKGAFSRLHRLSLMSYDPSTPHKAIRVHPLVQRVIRDALTPRQLRKKARVAACAIRQSWPSIEHDTMLSASLRANTARLRAVAGPDLWHRKSRTVLLRAGNSLGDSGQLPAARRYFEQLAISSQDKLGRIHPATLIVREILAHWRGEAGDPVGAATAFEELLHDLRWVSRKNPIVMNLRRHYARWRADAGDPVGAVAAMKYLVNDYDQVFGCNHAYYLYACNIYARCLDATGNSREAVAIMEKVVEGFLRIFGPDHVDTLSARNNLANFRGNAGDPAGAADALAKLLPDLQRVLGPNHPKTLRTRNNRARWSADAGDPIPVIASYELVIDCLRNLGPAHPDTHRARDNLTRSLGKTT